MATLPDPDLAMGLTSAHLGRPCFRTGGWGAAIRQRVLPALGGARWVKRRGVLSEEGSSTVETAVACTVLMAMLFGSTSEMVISQ